MHATTTTTTTAPSAVRRPAPIARKAEAATARELAAAQLAGQTGVGYGVALMLLLAFTSDHPELHGRFAFGPLR
jgi:hypothetical protein